MLIKQEIFKSIQTTTKNNNLKMKYTLKRFLVKYYIQIS